MNNIYEGAPVKILKIAKHTESEWSFILDYKTKNEPGKFVMISALGAGEVPISISGFFPESIELTIRNVGQVTSALFKKKVGDDVFFRGPYGNTFPVDDFLGKRLLIIAGGTGVAAVKSVIEYYRREDQCVLKELDILIGFRSAKNILFKHELKTWLGWSKKCRVLLTIDTHEDEEEEWKGNIGYVSEYIHEVDGLDAQTKCIVVGPPMMMVNTIKELSKFNIQEENIWVSFERHMKCGVGKCGHCRINAKYVCVDGPVFNYAQAKTLID